MCPEQLLQLICGQLCTLQQQQPGMAELNNALGSLNINSLCCSLLGLVCALARLLPSLNHHHLQACAMFTCVGGLLGEKPILSS
jgi:hypothetical protein